MTSTSEQPSEKSLEMARMFAAEWRTYLDWASDPEALSQLAALLDSRFKDGLKRAAEIAHDYRFEYGWQVSRVILKEAGTP